MPAVLGCLWMYGVLIGSLGGCGYTLVGGPSGGMTSPIALAVSPFTNETREPGLETRMTAALRQALVRHRAFSLTAKGSASRLLYGTVRRFRVVPLAFDANDNVLQYRLEANVAIRLVDTPSQSVRLEGEIDAWAEYLVSDSGIVRENVVARQAALLRLARQFARKCAALLTVTLL